MLIFTYIFMILDGYYKRTVKAFVLKRNPFTSEEFQQQISKRVSMKNRSDKGDRNGVLFKIAY